MFRRFREERFTQIAAALAYTTLLSLVPMVGLIVGILSDLPFFPVVLDQVNAFLVQNLLPDKAGVVIAKYTLMFSHKISRLTWIGVMVLAGTALVLMLTIERTFNHVWQVSVSRSPGRRLKLYLVIALVGPLVLGAVFGVTSYVVTASLGFFNEAAWVRDSLLKTLSATLLGAFFAFLYFAVPNVPVLPRHALWGGGFAALAITLMQRGFEFYLAKVPSYTLIYGAFAAVPIFLVWLYMSWLVVLLGALLAATLHRHHHTRGG
ncbi:MAG TPA: YihY family inner membrane protein [Azospira sp.]|nr:YihY family inner membrane protein [Azospira sp.]